MTRITPAQIEAWTRAVEWQRTYPDHELTTFEKTARTALPALLEYSKRAHITIERLAIQVIDGKANPEARRIYLECKICEGNDLATPSIVAHVDDCILAALSPTESPNE